MPKQAWLVQGLDGLKPIFQRRLSSIFAESEICELLRNLAARDLTHDEIISASLRKRMKGYKPLLEVKRNPGSRVVYYCGQNPHYVAGLFTEREFAEMDLEAQKYPAGNAVRVMRVADGEDEDAINSS